jgi:hypothetical protein
MDAQTTQNTRIEREVPYVETRGRPTSQEYLDLYMAEVGESFVSRKSRDTLYQIAKNLRIEVQISSAGPDGWRVWKRSERMTPEQWALHRSYKRLHRQRKSLIRKHKEE